MFYSGVQSNQLDIELNMHFWYDLNIPFQQKDWISLGAEQECSRSWRSLGTRKSVAGVCAGIKMAQVANVVKCQSSSVIDLMAQEAQNARWNWKKCCRNSAHFAHCQRLQSIDCSQTCFHEGLIFYQSNFLPPYYCPVIKSRKNFKVCKISMAWFRKVD